MPCKLGLTKVDTNKKNLLNIKGIKIGDKYAKMLSCGLA